MFVGARMVPNRMTADENVIWNHEPRQKKQVESARQQSRKNEDPSPRTARQSELSSCLHDLRKIREQPCGVHSATHNDTERTLLHATGRPPFKRISTGVWALLGRMLRLLRAFLALRSSVRIAREFTGKGLGGNQYGRRGHRVVLSIFLQLIFSRGYCRKGVGSF